MSAARSLFRIAPALALAVLATATLGARQAEPPDLVEARRLFDALDYEQAVPALDRAIAAAEALAPGTPGRAVTLTSAYELRARARFGIGDETGAKEDFRALLLLRPDFVLTEGISPRIVAIFDEVRKATIGQLQVMADPPDALLELDGQPFVPRADGAGWRAGSFTLRATRRGYAPAEQTVTITAGETTTANLTLERTAAVVMIVTSPPDTQVIVNGTSRGKTTAGPLPAAFADVPSRLGLAPDAVSQPLVLDDLAVGSYTVAFQRDCHVAEERTLQIERLADYRIDPVVLRPAVATVAVGAATGGGTVYLDGQARGPAPQTLENVCAGQHRVEIRAPTGRYVESIVVEPGQDRAISGRLRPVFALVPGGPAGSADLRAAVERALAPATRVHVYAPPPSDVDRARTAEGIPDNWLTSPELPALAERFAKALDVQGLAAVTPTQASGQEARLALVVPGSREPDTFSLDPGQAESVQAVLQRLDAGVPIARETIGVGTIDALDVKGVVIVRVDEGLGAAAAGLGPGEIITAAAGAPVATSEELWAVIGKQAPGTALELTVVDRKGAEKTVKAAVSSEPRLVLPADRFLAANVAVADLRAQAANATDAGVRSVIQLNLAAALLRAGDAATARSILGEVRLPPGPGVSQGTVEYLRGLAAQTAGDTAAARAAWKAAASADGRFGEDGPRVRDLAARALERIGR